MWFSMRLKELKKENVRERNKNTAKASWTESARQTREENRKKRPL
jgi:hypothetical protein